MIENDYKAQTILALPVFKSYFAVCVLDLYNFCGLSTGGGGWGISS